MPTESRVCVDAWTSTTVISVGSGPGPGPVTRARDDGRRSAAPCQACQLALSRSREGRRARHVSAAGGGGEHLVTLTHRLRCLRQQDVELEQKLELEMKMREGIHKLLAASRQPLQQLAAAKTLLTSTQRMLVYMSQLQKLKTEQVHAEQSGKANNSTVTLVKGDKTGSLLSKGKLSISDIRIPLMWKDIEVFQRVKTDSRRWVAFCLVKCGSEVYDSDMNTEIDCTSTDVTFSDNIVFADVEPDFELRLEVYAHLLPEDDTLISTSKKLRQKIETVGRRLPLTHQKSGGGTDDVSLVLGAADVSGPRYTQVGSALLTLHDVNSMVRAHDLDQQKTNDENPNLLGLFGHFCCRLSAQPNCLTQDVLSSYLNFQSMVSGQPSWMRLYCVLRKDQLSCYNSVADAEKYRIPKYNIYICKETEIHVAENNGRRHTFHILTINKTTRNQHVHTLSADNAEEMALWLNRIEQHIQNLVDWQQAGDGLMEINEPTNTKHQTYQNQSNKRSSYDEMSITDLYKEKNIINVNSNRVEKCKPVLSQMLNHAVLNESRRNQQNLNHHRPPRHAHPQRRPAPLRPKHPQIFREEMTKESVI